MLDDRGRTAAAGGDVQPQAFARIRAKPMLTWVNPAEDGTWARRDTTLPSAAAGNPGVLHGIG